MALQQEVHQIKGMQRDLTISKFSPEFAFDCQNIRITARDNNTLLSVTNERGTDLVELKGTDNNTFTLQGVTIGYCVLNKYLVLFNTTNVTDYIYRLEPKNGYFECVQLFTGSLNFSTSSPIETLGNYETDTIQKVYWVDGVNQPRVINIMKEYDSNTFDFKLAVTIPTVSIERIQEGGTFPSGVVQYGISYYNETGQQTPIIYVSDLQYISFSDRGASPEENVNCSFSITITNFDSSFKFLRVYSIVRTSIDAEAVVSIVAERNIEGLSSIVIRDRNIDIESVDSSSILLLSGNVLVAGTLATKDNTLFLGNIQLKETIIEDDVKETLRTNSTLEFKSRAVTATSSNDYYSYNIQTGKSSSKIKTFKGNETYRIGVQFQDKYGNYLQPIFLKDVLNPTYSHSSEMSDGIYHLPYIEAVIPNINNPDITGARLVMAIPSDSDRSIIAQGILCPTVFNISDRNYNSPYAQSSWFTRFTENIPVNSANWYPNKEFRHYKVIHNEIQIDSTDNDDIIYGSSTHLVTEGNVTYRLWYTHYSSAGASGTSMFYYNLTKGSDGTFVAEDSKYSYSQIYDSLLRYIPASNIPSQGDWGYAGHYGGSESVFTVEESQEEQMSLDLESANYKYAVDTSILTFHSPEIESMTNKSVTGLKLRILGRAVVKSVQTDYNVEASLGRANNSRVIKYNLSKYATSRAGFFNAKPIYYDHTKDSEVYSRYFVYPWHRSGSLNSDDVSTESFQRTAELSRKVISNLIYCYSTELFNTPWEAYIEGDTNHTGITDVIIFNSDTQSLEKIPLAKNSLESVSYYNYYGNVDRVLTYGDTEYPIYYTGTSGEFDFNNYDKVPESDVTGSDPVSIKYKTTPHMVFALNWTEDMAQVVLPKLEGEPNVTLDGIPFWFSSGSSEKLSYWVSTVEELDTIELPNDGEYAYVESTKNIYFYSAAEEWQGWGISRVIFPLYTYDGKVYKSTELSGPPDYSVTLVEFKIIYQDTIEFNNNPPNSYLYIAELYRDIDPDLLYGGTSESALLSNHWIPIGEVVPIQGDTITLTGTEGDTFYMRYDSLRTYPYTSEDINSIVDIASFMVESHINLDGRYDRNRGMENNLSVTPENFNLFNPVYNQSNNFFNYRILNERLVQTNLSTSIIWSLEKVANAQIDEWTNINATSFLSLDGDKGDIVSLNTFSNEIYCFQERGLSNILFNSRVQIPASDGVPIEITNGLKVSGKRYVSNSIGCSNKWSIAESPSGLYFVDNETNSIYLFNGQIQSLSDKLGLRQWVSENNSNNEWDPVDYGNFRTFYDKNNNDVYFTNSSTSLCYSELLGQFTSFMSYEKIPAMFNIGSEFYSVKDSQLWHNFSGDYNMFYGTFKPYSVTIVANSNEPYDKVFNTIEFRADSWDGGTLINNQTFDTLDVWNEYQHGTSTLTNVIGKPSPLKKKFRVWRANVPRDNSNKMDRIRNTWAYVKLSMNTQNTWRTEFHDMIIHYFM